MQSADTLISCSFFSETARRHARVSDEPNFLTAVDTAMETMKGMDHVRSDNSLDDRRISSGDHYE
ncbi:MAG: hypothetical protein Tsb009_12780 [Planctomycetaceae bacterium]